MGIVPVLECDGNSQRVSIPTRNGIPNVPSPTSTGRACTIGQALVVESDGTDESIDGQPDADGYDGWYGWHERNGRYGRNGRNAVSIDAVDDISNATDGHPRLNL